jgi:hypothetical protein
VALRYTDEDVARWYARYREGRTLKQVSAEFGAAPVTIMGEFLRRGWPRRSRGWRPPGASPKWAAIGEQLPTARPADVSERDWGVLLARRAGRTQAAIARELGLTPQRVAQIEAGALVRLGLAAPVEGW